VLRCPLTLVKFTSEMYVFGSILRTCPLLAFRFDRLRDRLGHGRRNLSCCHGSAKAATISTLAIVSIVPVHRTLLKPAM
jgi:hypothetical protein